MVFGVIQNVSKASSLLDNLSEADFTHVSVIMKDEKLRNTIYSDTGPFKGVTFSNLSLYLNKFALSSKEMNQIINSLNEGQSLIVIQTDKNSEKAALEMVSPYKPSFTKII